MVQGWCGRQVTPHRGASETMNATIETDMNDTPPLPPTNWRPPGWRDGADDDYAPESGHSPENTEESYAEFDARGYYTRGGLLTEKGRDAKDSETAEDVAWNRKALRDAWNTHPVVWRFASALIGRPFRVDPFWNEGARELPKLKVRLDGLEPTTDGMLTRARAMLHLRREDSNGREVWDYNDGALASTRDVADEIAARLQNLGDVADDFPLNWRQSLKRGSAAAACNGPHSCTEKWLACCDAYGREEFCAAFVPDNGDGWFQNIGMRAQLIVRLGRVPCLAPPGIKASSPRGASALLVWIPDAVQAEVRSLSKAAKKNAAALDRLLPAPVRNVLLHGHTFRTALWTRPKAGVQYAYVQPGTIDREVDREIDFGLLG